ncbi:MAG: hypothetical protein ABIZ36_06155 [Gemmatimonadaceae bacterium]
MTSVGPEKPARSVGHRLFHGRDPGPLLGPWLACAVVSVATYLFERAAPAFHDVVGPLYWLLLIIVSVATWRWARAREGVRGGDRREKDRRRTDRSSPAGTK